jgi:hypothetical protein
MTTPSGLLLNLQHTTLDRIEIGNRWLIKVNAVRHRPPNLMLGTGGVVPPDP